MDRGIRKGEGKEKGKGERQRRKEEAKDNCAIYSAQLVYVCVLAYDLGTNALFR